MRHHRLLATAAVLALLVGAGGAALGAGFEIAEVSGRQLGSAYSGKATSSDDPSVVFYNPAAMTMFPKASLVNGLHILFAQGDWNDGNTTGAGGGPLPGGDGGNPSDAVLLPTLFFLAPATEDLYFGGGLSAPFGLQTKWDSDWQGRYHAIKSKLEVINVTGTAAYAIDDMFSVGAGVNASWANAELTNAIDFGSIGWSVLGMADASALGMFPQMTDGGVEVESDTNLAWGWNAGLLVEVDEGLRFGLTYRSKISHALEGDGDFYVPDEATVLTSTGRFRDSDVTARLTLPEQVSVSAYYEIDPDWAVMGDLTWTRWSRFEELRIKFDNPAQPDSVTEEDWDDVIRIALGATYKASDEVTIRFGGAWDESPIPDDNRTVRIPTNDRIWAAAGMTWQMTPSVALDFSFMYVFIKDGDITETASTGQVLDGTVESSAFVLGFQATINF